MKLRILFASHAALFPPEHGGAKNVRHLARKLASEGHLVKVLVKLQPIGEKKRRFQGQYFHNLKEGEPVPALIDDGVTFYFIPGGSEDLAQELENEIRNFKPDFVLVGDDSLEEGAKLYEVASNSNRMVFVAQTIHSLSFGPYAMKPSEAISSSIRRAKQIIAPSCHVANYINDYLFQGKTGPQVRVYYPDVFGSRPFAKLGSRDNRYITMINPCPWKGSSILINLARGRPDLQFAAVPTWGATPKLIDELKLISNITLINECEDIDLIFSVTRILLVPSLCQEAFGLVSPEAMLRGIPVIASHIAGLKESTLGCARLIEVTPLSFHQKQESDDLTQFSWAEPENSVAPWSLSIDEILSSEASYEMVSEKGRTAANAFVKTLARRKATDLFDLGLT